MKRALVAALVLASALTGCGSSGSAKKTEKATPGPTTGAPVASGGCTPSGTGTTDLAKKPAYTVTSAKAPRETTVVDIVCGSGAEAVDGSSVEVKYVGVSYADGTEFDSSWKTSNDYTLPFAIGSQVIAGFSKGTTGMKVGGRREVIIPPKDGYGDGGPVPGGTLVFLIDLVKVS